MSAGPPIVVGQGVTAGPGVVLAGTQTGQAVEVSGGGAPQIDVGDVALDTPFALQRGDDGYLHPDPEAISSRPTATEVTAEIGTEVAAHVLSPEPHPAYDDIPSLSLLFASRLV